MPAPFIFPAAEGVPFDNSTNGFTSTDTQAAIEEIGTGLATTRFTIVTTFNGSIGNNQWLGYNELLPGNNVPIRLPVNCILKELSFSYSGTSVDGEFRLFKNGLVDPTNVVYTETFTNQDNGKIVSSLNISLSSGDYIVGKWIDTGTNPSDLALVYYFETT